MKFHEFHAFRIQLGGTGDSEPWNSMNFMVPGIPCESVTRNHWWIQCPQSMEFSEFYVFCFIQKSHLQ